MIPNAQRKVPLYLGFLSIAVGIAFNKCVQAAAIIIGMYFVVRQPSIKVTIRRPNRSETVFAIAGISVAVIFLEAGMRLFLSEV